MNNKGLILNIKNSLHNVEGYSVYVSEIITVPHEVYTDTKVENILKIYLHDTETGNKYLINNYEINQDHLLLNITPQEHDLGFFNELLIITKEKTYREKVERKLLKRKSIPIYSNVGSVPFLLSNLLYPRIKIGFPKWSTVFKHNVSNVAKTLEPLMQPFYDSYHKIITSNLLTKGLNPWQNYLRFKLNQHPAMVLKKIENNWEVIHATTSRERSPLATKIVPTTQKSYSTSLYLEANEEVRLTHLTGYLFGVSNNTTSKIHVKGYDTSGIYREEFIRCRRQIYTQSTYQYSSIIYIVADDSVVLSNNIDCSFDHYVIKDITTTAPIVNPESLNTFNPIGVLSYNEEQTRQLLHIYNAKKDIAHPVYTFDLQHSSPITSLYIDEHLRIFWTDKSYLYSGTLGIDLSKDIVNTDYEKVITLSSYNTAIQDYLDISINLEDVESEAVFVQLSNDTTTLYYNQDTGEFSDQISLVYPQRATNNLELRLQVLNDKPYIVKIIDSDNPSKIVAATSCSQTIKSVNTKRITEGQSLYYNGKLLLGKKGNLETMIEESSNDNIEILIEPKGVYEYDWVLELEGYTLTKESSTFEEGLVRKTFEPSLGNKITKLTVISDKIGRKINNNILNGYLTLFVDSFYAYGDNSLEMDIHFIQRGIKRTEKVTLIKDVPQTIKIKQEV